MDLSPRSREILDAIFAYEAEHEAFQRDHSRQFTDSQYWDAVELMAAIVTGGDYPYEIFPVLSKYEIFAKEAKKHDESEDITPGDSFWQAREALVDAAHELQREAAPKLYKDRLPTIAELKDQGVGDPQICLMWGLMEDGLPRFDLLRKEIAEPGSVINDDYEHPEDTKARRKYEDAKRRLSSLAPSQPAQKQAPKPIRTPRQVWEDNRGLGTPILPSQAALMCQVDVDEIKQLWERWDQEEADPEANETGDKEKSPKRSQLFEQAKSLGISVTPKHTNAQIRAKIEALQKAEGASV